MSILNQLSFSSIILSMKVRKRIDHQGVVALAVAVSSIQIGLYFLSLLIPRLDEVVTSYLFQYHYGIYLMLKSKKAVFAVFL